MKVTRTISTALFIVIISRIFSHAGMDGANQKDATLLAMEGRKLTSEAAKNLEDKLRADPTDLSLRTKLLGYYFDRQFQEEYARKARQGHILWIIQNHPDAGIAGLPYASLDPILDGDQYFQAKKMWLKQVETHKNNSAILGNAASFFLIHDKDVAEDLLKKAQIIEPNNPEWSLRLGHLHALGMSGKPASSKRESGEKSFEQMVRALKNTTKEEDRFYMYSDLAKAAFEAGKTDKARLYAIELLNTAPHFKNNWNYGNAVHHGNLILGRLALKEGDIGKARAYLIDAGKTPGSPQLNSFGPNMTLAKELLEKGEKEAVIEYFQLCAKFWEMGGDNLKKWTYVVKGGGTPDFGANLDY